MKNLSAVFALAAIALITGLLFTKCNKTSSGPGEPSTTTPVNPVTPGSSTELAQSVERLTFFGAGRRDGKVPDAPGGSSLKKSFRDTLYLADQVRVPISFLHADAGQDVSGMYVSYTGGSFYYHVPELKDTEKNDTVSTFLVGFNQAGVAVPLLFNITLTPIGKGGQPITSFQVPVKINALNDDPSRPGACGLTLPGQDYWRWSMSYTIGESSYTFMNYPLKKHGEGGQFIKGCCKDGRSFYNINCSSDTALHRSLHFLTYFQFPEESFRFRADNTYDRTTIQHNANPDPPASDFCGNGKGVVIFDAHLTQYVGKWSISKQPVPTDLKFSYTSRNYLTLQTTTSTGGGYSNAGGIIHYMDCRNLMLIQPDREGGGQHLYKIYKRVVVQDPDWYPVS